MTEILVSGYYGFKNAGDEAILAGMIRAFRDMDPEVSFTVISGTVANTRAVHGVSAVSRGDSKAIWRAAGKADLVISGGGSLLQDITSAKSLIYYLGIMSMAKFRFKPVMAYAQGIGPVGRAVSKTLVPLVLNAIDLVTVRDHESAEALRALGVRRPPVVVTADAALALGPSDPEYGAQLLKEAGVDLDRPVIGVSVRPWKPGEEHWEPALGKALDTVALEAGAQVVFLPMQQHRLNDVEAATRVSAAMQSKPILVQGDLSYAHIQAMIARCDLLIGMRYHALVFAAMNGVPLVGLSYDPKNDSFLRLIGEKAAGTTSDLQTEAVVTAARRALSEAPAFRQRLLQRMAELTPLSRSNARMALEYLQQRGRR